MADALADSTGVIWSKWPKTEISLLESMAERGGFEQSPGLNHP